MTVAELLARVSSVELTEWQQYAVQVGGLRDQRAEIHAAQHMALLANVHRRKGTPPYRVEDFLPHAEPTRRQPMSDFRPVGRKA